MSARSCAQFVLQALADLLEVEAGEVLVEIVGGLGQFARRIGALGEQDAVLHVALGGDDDEQDALVGQAEEFDLADPRQLAARRHHHAGEVRQLGQQLRGMADHPLRLVGLDGVADLGDLLVCASGRTVSRVSTNRR